MITRIGIIAGEIWEYLEHHNRTGKLNDMVSALGRDRDHVLMSIGWLAREGHIFLEGEGPNYTVNLKVGC